MRKTTLQCSTCQGAGWIVSKNLPDGYGKGVDMRFRLNGRDVSVPAGRSLTSCPDCNTSMRGALEVFSQAAAQRKA